MVSRALYRALTLPMMLTGGLVMLGQSSNTGGKRVEVVKGISVTPPAPWFLANRTRNAIEIAYPRSGASARVPSLPGKEPESGEELITAEARLVILVEPWPNQQQALDRLAQLAVERAENVDLKVLAGWPGIAQTWPAPLPATGEAQEQSQGTAANLAQFANTSIAVENRIVRFSAVLAPGADPKLLSDVAAIIQGVQAPKGNATTAQQELERVSKRSPPSGPPVPSRPKRLLASPAAYCSRWAALACRGASANWR